MSDLEEQIHLAKKAFNSWPQWMKDAAYVACAQPNATMYQDMELVYKPTMEKLRSDMAKMMRLAWEIAEIGAAHEWPMPKTGTALQPEVQAKSPHESSLQEVYDRVDLTYERKGDGPD